jgi:hypothetical protein
MLEPAIAMGPHFRLSSDVMLRRIREYLSMCIVLLIVIFWGFLYDD